MQPIIQNFQAIMMVIMMVIMTMLMIMGISSEKTILAIGVILIILILIIGEVSNWYYHSYHHIDIDHI